MPFFGLSFLFVFVLCVCVCFASVTVCVCSSHCLYACLPMCLFPHLTSNICCSVPPPDDPTQFWEQDRHYYSRLESSRWLSHISKCMEVAQSAATAILHHSSSVILQGVFIAGSCCSRIPLFFFVLVQETKKATTGLDE